MSNIKHEVDKLNKTCNELRSRLFESEAENQKLKLELECVLELLKKAWNGDRLASMHITNILQNAEVSNAKQQSLGVPSSDTVREAIVDQEHKSKILRSRNDYLNHEYVKTAATMSNIPVSCNTSQTLSRPSSSVLRPTSTSGVRPNSRSLGSRRARSAVGIQRHMPTAFTPDQNLQLIQANEKLELWGLNPKTSVRYDDPSRYTKEGLFNKSTNLQITGTSSSLSNSTLIYSQGLHPKESARVHAAQIISAKRKGLPITSQSQQNRRPPSGILAVQDRPLKNEMEYFEPKSNRRPQSGRSNIDPNRNKPDSRPQSSSQRGIRFADDVDEFSVHSKSNEGDTDLMMTPRQEDMHDEKKRRAALAIQRRIGISGNGIVLPP